MKRNSLRKVSMRVCATMLLVVTSALSGCASEDMVATDNDGDATDVPDGMGDWQAEDAVPDGVPDVPGDGDGGDNPDGDGGDVANDDVPGENEEACIPTGEELCDGVDNDCNGETDEGFHVGEECTIGSGDCESSGVLVCSRNGSSSVCDAEPVVGPPETCDGVDNDCDGLIDEYGVCDVTSCLTSTPGTERCSYPFGDASTTPAISSDGTVYITSPDPAGTGYPKLHALGLEDCAPGWVFTSDEQGWFRSPVIGADGTIYVGFTSMYSDIPSKLLAINPAGSLVWSFPFTVSYVSPTDLVLGNDGTIYVCDGYGSWFHAVNGDGTLKWSLDVGGSEFHRSPAMGPDGTIYAGSWKYSGSPPAAVYAIVDEGDHGSIEWQFAPAGGNFSVSHSPAVAADGTVYIGLFLPSTGNITLYAIDPSAGREDWHYDMTATTTANESMAIGADGTVYVKSTDANGKLYAIRPDGTSKWTPFDTGVSSWYESPALGADGTLYIGASGSFFGINSADGSLVWEAAIDGTPGSPTIAPNGTVFFPTTTPSLVGLCSASAGLAVSPWPKDLHEERNCANSSAR